jgi:transposase-like protein
MAVERACCSHCQSVEAMKYGTTATGKERFRCQTAAGCGRTFLREYVYRGR